MRQEVKSLECVLHSAIVTRGTGRHIDIQINGYVVLSFINEYLIHKLIKSEKSSMEASLMLTQIY